MSSPQTSTTPPTDPTPEDLLEVARRAAAAAADRIRSLDRNDLQREYKSGSHDIVTEHDRWCEHLIAEVITAELPGARICGEEGGERRALSGGEDADASVASNNRDITFFVDPIDGTSNFAAGLPLFCVSVGVAVGDELVAGVIDAPVLDQVFTAADGPAYLNGVPLRPRSTRAPQDALVLSGYPGYLAIQEQPEISAAAVPLLQQGVSAVRHFGSAALELAYVAAGWADATFTPSINAWDIAAGLHLVRRAGGSVRAWPGTGPSDAPDHECPAYAACSGPERIAVVDELLDRVQEGRDQRARAL
jgi:myo-inositol-1(or 4)-monophosphatase